MTKIEAREITGGLSKTSKMPGYSYSIHPSSCGTGSLLRGIPGSVCHNCYAQKGRYCFKGPQNAMHRRLKSIEHPLWVEAMVSLIDSQDCRWFRWHDAGDVQGWFHLDKIFEVSRRLPEYKFFLPTKEYSLVRDYVRSHQVPANLVIRVGAPMIDQVFPKEIEDPVKSSMVCTKDKLPGDVWVCPATADPQRKTCGSCRACWATSCPCVAYVKH